MIIHIGRLQNRAKVSRSGQPEQNLNALRARLVLDSRQSHATRRLSNLEQGHSITMLLNRNSVLSVLPNTLHTVLSPCPPRLPTRATCSISIISSSSRRIPNSWLRISIVKVSVHRPVVHTRQLIKKPQKHATTSCSSRHVAGTPLQTATRFASSPTLLRRSRQRTSRRPGWRGVTPHRTMFRRPRQSQPNVC
jgi:hypothetical protein